MLLLIDLDNTLIDRSAAFRRWSAQWASAHGGTAADVDWLNATDNDGYEPRERFAAAIGARFGLETIWLPLGTTWPPALPYRPTRTATSCAAAIRSLL